MTASLSTRARWRSRAWKNFGRRRCACRAPGKDAPHEATTHARPAAAAPVPPEGSVAAILPYVQKEQEDGIWKKVETDLTELIEEKT